MHKKHPKLIYLIIIAALAATLLYVVLRDQRDYDSRERDTARLLDIGKIQAALGNYHNRYGSYPACLYLDEHCKTGTLEGTSAMTVVPRDPLTNIGYVYAAIGKGSSCTSYHIGASLERHQSQALITGSDAPPVAGKDLCAGSAKDFSGLSNAAAGQQCDLSVGIPQPTDSQDGESCYDLRP